EATMAFAATRPADIPRIALVDFRNDCVGTSLEVIRTMFRRWLELTKAGQHEEARKYKLFGVRPDTAANLRDVSVPPLGDKRLDCGVNPRLVFLMRAAIDREWQSWPLSPEDTALAPRDCPHGHTLAAPAVRGAGPPPPPPRAGARVCAPRAPSAARTTTSPPTSSA